MQKSSKAQLITILVLVLFLLMVTLLFSFVVININTNNLAQSLAVSSSSSNYGDTLTLSAGQFAKSSLSGALSTLATYEMTPSLRKGNLISNFSMFMSQLTVNGIIFNDTSGYPQNAMMNLTFSAYNASIARMLGFASQNVIINESRPVVFQPDPYHLGIRYAENVAINASGNVYQFNIPVNISISLNNSPDLFYAQQGILRAVKFASINNLTIFMQNVSAVSGNLVGYAYGPLYTVPSSAGSSATCPLPGLPYGSLASLQESTIIVTYNALNLGSCINGYGGLVTYVAPTSTPTVPFLVYAASSNILSTLPNGEHVLLYGPNLHLTYIENLRNAISSGYYFSSPFTPSYIDRSVGHVLNQSQNGIFTFSNYNTQAAIFSGAGNYINIGKTVNALGIGKVGTFAGWAYSAGNYIGVPNAVYLFSDYGTNALGMALRIDGGTNPSTVSFYIYPSNYRITTNTIIKPNTWYFIAGTMDGTYMRVYVNGVLAGSLTPYGAIGISSNTAEIGVRGDFGSGSYGSIANMQVYSTALSAQQVQQLYQEGISALPISSNSLVGWWPLSVNANDISGNNFNGVSTGVSYTNLLNYTRDSIFTTPFSSPLAALPGILSDTNTSQATNALASKLFLSSLPIRVQPGLAQVGHFDGATSYIASTVPLVNTVAGGHNTVSFWMYWTGGYDELPISFSTGSTSAYSLWLADYTPPPCFGFNTGNGGGVSNEDAYGIDPTSLANNWVYVTAIFYNGAYTGNSQLYINGVQQSLSQCYGSASAGGTVSSGLQISGYAYEGGEQPAGDQNAFGGQLANIQIYNTSLSQQQISQLYNEGVLGTPLSANIVAWYPLGGNGNDYSGYATNGQTFNTFYPNTPAGYLPSPYGPFASGSGGPWLPVSGLASIGQILNITNNANAWQPNLNVN